MNNSDFLSFFPDPETNGTADSNTQDLAIIFDGLNGEASEQGTPVDNDDFSAMLDGIEMLEEMLVETELAGEEALQEMTPLEQETSVMFEGNDLHYEEMDEDAISLTPPFLRAYEVLQEQVISLGQRLASTEQELTGHRRRTSSAESLIEQQAIALTQAQEQLAHTVAELQIYQEACKQQQLQVETLTEQLAASQELVIFQQNQLNNGAENNGAEIQELRTQMASLAAENGKLKSQIGDHSGEVARLEQQLTEMSARLQRQQRYALQYKSALEQCLAQPDFHPPADIIALVAGLTGQSKELKPWASVGDVLASFASGNTEPASAPVVDLTPGLVNFSPSPDKQTASQPLPSNKEQRDYKNKAEKGIASAPLEPAKPIAPIPAIDRLSFAVKEPRPSRRPIDLPGFLPRATPMG
ncbi:MULTISPECIES: hypothetical protein [unclassified Synechocystis]|uniref:hypothetical protein n=1 Tax=unclassified Synechocystis TaxID=2640012 RepID=UPI00040A8E65|nr:MULTISPECIES: hypothetical protein [unclassified Synechocystis]AIE74576.1 hypothetical protein D082_20480 [Synechocystis sp. PCC 6714]MCT0254060.1 hypothetical protein [Synechocystis sp. CS-94]